MKIFYYFLFMSVMLNACSDDNNTEIQHAEKVDVRNITNQNAYSNGLEKLVTQLKLDNIKNGYDSLQIRIWLGHSMAFSKHVLILKCKRGWTGQLIKYGFGNDELRSKVEHKDLKIVKPQSGWDYIEREIERLQIVRLEDCLELEGYDVCGGLDGISYVVEVATFQKYRQYAYCNPEILKKRFWQARNILDFSSTLEHEFNFRYTK